MSIGPGARLSTLWRAPAEAQFASTSLGLSGGLWSLPIRQKLEVPALDHMRLIVNLAPLENHSFWSDGRLRRSGVSVPGAIRIAPIDETAFAEVRGAAFRFAQVYIPTDALTALGGGPLSLSSASAFRDLRFETIDPLVSELVQNLLRSEGDPAEILYRDHLSLALLSHLHHRYGTEKPRLRLAGQLDARRLRLVLDRLEQFEVAPSIRELGFLAGLSPHHLTRSFRLAVGMPPHAWLRRLRIERAKQALLQGHASITEIALDCGYASPSAFTAAFTRLTGCSPSTWRRIH